MKSKVYRHKGKTYVKIEFEVQEEKHFDKDEMQARLNRTLPWLKEHLVGWADFDQQFTITLFCDALKALALGLKRWDNCTMSDRNYKRCLHASEKLRKAYDAHTCDDKSYQRLSDANPIKWGKIKGQPKFMQMYHDYSPKGQDYHDKMWKLINKRTEKVIADNKKEAWEFIHKYIEHFWD
jgi:hypothetical protein